MLTQRKNTILKCLIDSFIQRAEPVGSKKILEFSNLPLSSATIRNELSNLEKEGYITHPHTSAGRIPTDKGYRYYVDYLMGENQVNLIELKRSLEDLKKNIKSIDEFLQASSKIISTFTHQVGIIVFPSLDDLFFRYVNLISIGGNRVLVVWATMSGVIRDQIVTFDKNISDEELKKISNFMNQELVGMPFLEMKQHLFNRLNEIKDSYHEVYRLAKQIVDESVVDRNKKKVFIDGMRRFLEYPEFQDILQVKPLFELMEDADSVAELLEQEEGKEGIQITIGRENPSEPLWNCSILKQNYSIQDKASGTLSILGPRRMPYGSTSQTIQFVSQFISDTMRDESFRVSF